MGSNQAANAAAQAAKVGLGMLFSATKTTINAVATGVSIARQKYANKHEADTLKDLQTKGTPVDAIFAGHSHITPKHHVVPSVLRFVNQVLRPISLFDGSPKKDISFVPGRIQE